MDKKDIVFNNNKNRFIYAGIIAALIIVIAFLVIPSKKQEAKPDNNSRYKLVEGKDGVVSFPVASFDDNVQYFEYRFETVTVSFFILKSNDGTIRAAFDACDVCYRSRRGYHQVGDHMQCNNCGQTFPEDKINVVLGGCNPSPLTREIIGDNLTIKIEDIAQGKRFF